MIRKIDELGRVVLPKEIRRNLGIRDGESLEIFVDENHIILKKYSRVEDYSEKIDKICNLVSDVYNCQLIITDRDKVVYSNLKESILGCEINEELLCQIHNRESVHEATLKSYSFGDTEIQGYYLIFPIISSIDCLGLVIMFSEEKLNNESFSLLKLISTMIISKIDIA